MSGLTDIVNGILKGADDKADVIKAEAKEKYEKIISLAKEEADAENAALLKKAETEKEQILKSAFDTVNAEKRLVLLSAKREIVENMLVCAKEKLMNISGEKYEALLLKLFEKNVKSGSCTVFFPEGDVFSEGFSDSFKKVAEKADCNIEAYKRTDRFKKGFILTYPCKDGEKIENCSFDRLFDSCFGELCDKAAEILFK